MCQQVSFQVYRQITIIDSKFFNSLDIALFIGQIKSFSKKLEFLSSKEYELGETIPKFVLGQT
jgi:hypothetical protein